MKNEASPNAPRPPRRETWPFFALIVGIDLLTLAIAFLPLVLLALGLQALGAAAGLWPGDPNSNDGEEGFATIIGAVGVVLVLAVAAVPVAYVARRQHRPPIRTALRNILVLLGVCLVLGILSFTL
jgi:hypothetical protein